LWLNSLGVDPFVHNLYDCVSDGTVLLQAIEYIRPDLIEKSRVNVGSTSRFKWVENTNYLINIGNKMVTLTITMSYNKGFTLVGVQGSDITDGVKILVLGYVWQLMVPKPL